MSEIDAMLKELLDCAMKIIEIEEDLHTALSETTDTQTKLSAAYEKLGMLRVK